MQDWTLAFKIPVILREHSVGLSGLTHRSTNATCSHNPNGQFDLDRLPNPFLDTPVDWNR